MARWIFLLSVVLWGCGTRATSSAQDGPDRKDGAAADTVLGDTVLGDGPAVVGDGPVVVGDGALALDAGPLTFCSGAPKVSVGGRSLKITGFSGGLGVMASCCGPGEYVVVQTDDAGKVVTLTLEVLRWPQTPAPGPSITIDLANPPSGWMVAVRCDPSDACGAGRLREDNATLTGTLTLMSLLGAPAYEVSLCLDAVPKATPGPQAKPVKIYFQKVLINTACAFGMDQTCNADPLISSLRGKCNADSTCTCIPGANKTPNGKCM